MKLSEKKNILGVGFTTNPEVEILEYIVNCIERGGQKIKIFTPNPEMILLARRDPHFRDVLNSATIALPDGMGVVVASRFLKKDIRERIAGVDFMKSVIKRISEDLPKSAKRQASIGFIGGREKVAERTAVCLQKLYPGAQFFVYDKDINAKNFIFKMQEFTKITDGQLTSEGVKKLDILFVAFGFPLQEKWINANLPHIPVTVAMGVGGSFDIIAGKTRRAPKVMQKMGLEWSWRLAGQPWRIRRQIKLAEYPYLVLKEWITRK